MGDVCFWPEPGGKDLDPDKVVDELRDLHAGGGPPDFERAINLFMALDTHLIFGGKLPTTWQKGQKT